MKCRGFILNIRKCYFSVRTTDGWHRLPRDIVRKSIPGDTQKPSRHHWTAHYSCPCLSREIDLDNLQSTLSTSINPLFCDSVYLDNFFFFLTAGFLHLCEKFCLTNSLCSTSREKSLKYTNNIHPKLSRLLFHPDNDSET